MKKMVNLLKNCGVEYHYDYRNFFEQNVLTGLYIGPGDASLSLVRSSIQLILGDFPIFILGGDYLISRILI